METHTRNHDALYKWLALGVVVIGTFMAILDSSIVNVAIPKMMAVFGVSTDQIQWVLTGYMLTMGSVIPLTGYLGDKYGTKKVYVWALTAFTIGSALCGFAWSNNAMIAARVIQALGGGMIMPTSMAIIYQVIPQEERGMALGIWGIAAMAAPAIGPTLSGYIVEHLDWRLIFTINIPVGVVAVVLSLLLLKESPLKPVKGFDFIGFLASTMGLVSILYVLGEGANIDWGDFTNIFLLIFGFFSLTIFVINELYTAEPLLELRIFKIWPFTLSVLISSMTNIALFGGIFLMPLYLQTLQGFTPMQTGIIMFPSAIATGLMMPISGKLFDKFGAKPMVIPGLCILAYATYELSKISLDTSAHTVTWLLVIRGFGMGMAMMPATTSGMNQVPAHLVGKASSLSNVIRQIAGSVGIAILSTILTRQQAVDYARLAEQFTSFNANNVQLFKGIQGLYMSNGLPASAAQTNALAAISGLIQKNSFMLAINDTFIVTFAFACITIPLAFMLKDKQIKTAEVAQAHVVME